MTDTIVVNQETGVRYYSGGSQDGQSVDRFVAVTDGQVRNPNGSGWPVLYGNKHDERADYYEVVPYVPIPFDAEIYRVADEQSGWSLTQVPSAPGCPQGTYERTEAIVRRSQPELRALVTSYANSANGALWPQGPGYDEILSYAKEQIQAGNNLQTYRDVVNRHEQLIAATLSNNARLEQLLAEIEQAGESGPIDFIASEGWVNAV